MKHEWKAGDMAVFEVLDVVRGGDLYLGEDGAGVDGYISPKHATPLPDHSQYIGQTLADVPDGTVAVVQREGVGGLAVRRKHLDGAYLVCEEHKCLNFDRRAGQCTILHIIKLGEPKPVTLAEAVVKTKVSPQPLDCVMLDARDWRRIEDLACKELSK